MSHRNWNFRLNMLFADSSHIEWVLLCDLSTNSNSSENVSKKRVWDGAICGTFVSSHVHLPSCVQKIALLESSSPETPLLRWPLNLEKREWDIDAPFGAKYGVISSCLHFNQVCISVLIVIYQGQGSVLDEGWLSEFGLQLPLPTGWHLSTLLISFFSK